VTQEGSQWEKAIFLHRKCYWTGDGRSDREMSIILPLHLPYPQPWQIFMFKFTQLISFQVPHYNDSMLFTIVNNNKFLINYNWYIVCVYRWHKNDISYRLLVIIYICICISSHRSIHKTFCDLGLVFMSKNQLSKVYAPRMIWGIFMVFMRIAVIFSWSITTGQYYVAGKEQSLVLWYFPA
jgi:hypothetical protein